MRKYLMFVVVLLLVGIAQADSVLTVVDSGSQIPIYRLWISSAFGCMVAAGVISLGIGFEKHNLSIVVITILATFFSLIAFVSLPVFMYLTAACITVFSVIAALSASRGNKKEYRTACLGFYICITMLLFL